MNLVTKICMILCLITTIPDCTEAASSVKAIPNPHMSGDGQCLCASQAIQPKNTIISPAPLQPDTFLSMEHVKVAEYSIPIYQFKQPERLSAMQLPFKIVLQNKLPTLNEVHHVEVGEEGFDSWFVGYKWSVLICSNCNGKYTHIGWHFKSISGGNDFYALIVKTSNDNSIFSSISSMEAFREMIQIGVPAPSWMLGLLASQTVVSKVGL